MFRIGCFQARDFNNQSVNLFRSRSQVTSALATRDLDNFQVGPLSTAWMVTRTNSLICLGQSDLLSGI
jgi:hypothetical protein